MEDRTLSSLTPPSLCFRTLAWYVLKYTAHKWEYLVLSETECSTFQWMREHFKHQTKDETRKRNASGRLHESPPSETNPFLKKHSPFGRDSQNIFWLLLWNPPCFQWSLAWYWGPFPKGLFFQGGELFSVTSELLDRDLWQVGVRENISHFSRGVMLWCEQLTQQTHQVLKQRQRK